MLVRQFGSWLGDLKNHFPDTIDENDVIFTNDPRRQRRYHFGVARGSAAECAALTDVLRLRRLTPASECFRARSLAVRCVQMLTKLVESMGPAEAKAEPA